MTTRTTNMTTTIRHGVTLTEVLIAIGVLAVGLLGAASVFPVGGFYMQKGEIADRGAAIAQAAFADLIARDELNPEKWLAADSVNRHTTTMRSAMAGGMSTTSRNYEFGMVYMLDPFGIAEAVRTSADLSGVPYAPYMSDSAINDFMNVIETRASKLQQDQWRSFVDVATGHWPMRRMKTTTAVVNGLISPSLAQRNYTSGDDLAFSLSEEEAPTQQRVIGPDSNGDGIPEAIFSRQSEGNYSWLVTVVPADSPARDALATDPAAYSYHVSVVVFYKRPAATLDTSERLVMGKVETTGTSGGDLLLETLANDNSDAPYDELKQGQWVMVCGPHPMSTATAPFFFAQWYRVLAIDHHERGDLTDARTQRIVGLRGPAWPFAADAQVGVGIFPGAVAVHSKTIRLEGHGPYAAN